MMALYDPNENQDVMGDGSGLRSSERLPASAYGAAGPAMPIEDVVGGGQTEADHPEMFLPMKPRANEVPGLLLGDLNRNGIPDGADVTFKQQRDDGSSITAKFRKGLALMEESLPKYQPGPAPRAPGMPFDPNGSMAPYNSLGPMAQARIMGNRTLEDQRAYVQGRENTYNAGVRNEADRKMAYDLAKTEALTKFGGGLMALEGTGVKADATTDAALFRALGTGAMADAKRYSSDNFLTGTREKVAGGIVQQGIETQGNLQQQGLRNEGAANVAGINAGARNPYAAQYKPGDIVGTDPQTGATFIWNGERAVQVARQFDAVTGNVLGGNTNAPPVAQAPAPRAAASPRYKSSNGKFYTRGANGEVIWE